MALLRDTSRRRADRAVIARWIARSRGNDDVAVPSPSHYAAYDPDASRRRDVPVTVRAALRDDPRDVDAAARLATDVYGGDQADWRERFTRVLQRPGSALALAEVDGQVAGYGKAASCTPVDDADPAPAGRYLTGLVVAAPWRRRGVGEALTRWRLQLIHADGEPAYFFTNVRNAASCTDHGRW